MKRLAVAGLAALAVVAFSVPAGAQAQEAGSCEPEVQPNGAMLCSDFLDLGFSLNEDPVLSANIGEFDPLVIPLRVCDVVEIIVGPQGATLLGCEPGDPEHK